MPRSQGTSRKGKPKKGDRQAGMGRALQKAQYKKYTPKANLGGMAASGATSIGMQNENNAGDKIKSVLETNNLTDFIARAEMADREFEVEKEQFIVLDDTANEVRFDEASVKFDFSELAVPRRPKWDESTTAQELDMLEKEAFLDWRRKIAMREETVTSVGGRIAATPFEKNLEVWRQLWRVLERADSIAMVVDGRNPLFYVSSDLRVYVEEELGKSLVIIINKCDYLTEKQRRNWHDYFENMGLEHVFFSAFLEQQVLDDAYDLSENGEGVLKTVREEENYQNSNEEGGFNEPLTQNANKGKKTLLDPDSIGIERPLTRAQLLQILCNFAKLGNASKKGSDMAIELGMVGFPNVGKSSVLNVLVGASKRNHQSQRVGVASQPGKTKHFQTLHVPDRKDVVLCDCPGLVFPSFVTSAADLVVAGVYPLSQVREFWPAVELIARRIPREVLEAFYGFEFPKRSALDVGRDGQRKPQVPLTAEELLDTYCIARSMLAASSGVPDHHRASRIILSDYVNGRLLYCHAPPLPPDETEEKWELSFRQETFSTTMKLATKVREKLVAQAAQKEAPQIIDEDKSKGKNADSSDLTGLEDDMDMFDLIGGDGMTNGNESNAPAGKRGKKHKSMQKWGKKGRKTRNKDPYGCHSEPDDELLGGSGRSGLVVNAGKYGSDSYTRPHYAGAKSVAANLKRKE